MLLKKTLTCLSIILFFFAGFTGVAYCQKNLWPTTVNNYFIADKQPGFIPKSTEIKSLLFGYDNFVADLYWLKTIQFTGANAAGKKFESLYEMLDLITDLDENFEHAYHFSALMLPLSGAAEQAINLLQKGRRNLPTSWQMIWDMAFVRYFYLDQYEEAALLYDECSQMEGCLSGAAKTAANLRSKMGKYEIALEEWIRIFKSDQADNSEKDLASIKIEELTKLINLSKLAEKYEQIHWRQINDLEELKSAFPDIPADAFVSPFKHNPFIWDKKVGRIKTMHW